MKTIIILAQMEIRGFRINYDALQELSTVIRGDLLTIEQKAFRLAGRKFNFSSSKEVSLVIVFPIKIINNHHNDINC